MDDARAVFLFRSRELDYSYRDIPRQKQLLREAYAGMGWEVPCLMAELDRTAAFYFDSITQIHMSTWSRGRVSLVGDAGYCPGPAVGGGTSLAVADGDHVRAFRVYERELGDSFQGDRRVSCVVHAGCWAWLARARRA
jgi:2-polyprenyl-6-methoxyphenol hydroxylase-like FAD-dependent oxidoreductase